MSRFLDLVLVLAAATSLFAAEPRIVNAIPLRSGLTDAPEFLAIGDFTGDGRNDILAASATSVRVLRGTNDHSFAHATSTAIAGARVAGAADLNGDGRLDLLLKDRDGSGFRTLMALPDGRFGEGFRSPTRTSVLVAAHFDADAHLDIAAIGLGVIHVFPGDGAGGFGAPTTTSVTLDHPLSVAAGDFDGDGRVDLAVETSHTIRILWNEGNRAFSQPVYYPEDGAPAAGDCNGDGVDDLLAYDRDDDEIIVAYGVRGSRTLANPTTHIPVDHATTVQLHDVNGDGRDDVVFAASWSQVAGVVTANANNTFNAPQFYLSPPLPELAAFGDADGDGALDFVSASTATPPLVSVVRGNAGGTFDAPAAIDMRAAIGTRHSDAIRETELTDVTGDGRRDVVVLDWRDARVCVIAANEQGSFARVASCTSTESKPRDDMDIFVAGDLDGDGLGDVIVTKLNDSPSDTRWNVLHGQRDGTFRHGATISGVQSFQLTTLIAVVDLTGDGKADLLGASGLLYPGNGNGTFGTPVDTHVEDLWIADTDFGDFDRDGRTDILARRGNHLVVHRNRGNGVFEVSEETWSYSPHRVGDFDRDGTLDLMVGSDAYFFQRGNGDGTFADVWHTLVSWFEGGSVTGDFDGDGNLDVATGASVTFGDGAGSFRSATSYPDAVYPSKYNLLGVEQRAGAPPSLILRRWFAEMLAAVPLSDVHPETPARLTLSFDPAAPTFGELVTITAALANDRDAVQPTGAVRLLQNGKTEAVLQVDAEGKAVLRGYFEIGSTTITAAYVGDERFAATSTTGRFDTAKGASTIFAMTNRIASNRLVPATTFALHERIYVRSQLGSTLGFTISGAGITIRNGAEVLAVASAPNAIPSVAASLLGPGTHTLTVEWPGDERYTGSSTTVTFTIEPPPSGPRRRSTHH